MFITLVLVILAPLASAHPDGLEWVAEETGFLDAGIDPSYEILPDYTVPFVESEAGTTILAGVIGVLVVFGVAYGVAHLRRGRGEVSA